MNLLINNDDSNNNNNNKVIIIMIRIMTIMIKTCCVNTKHVTQFGRLLIKQYNTYSMQGKKPQYLRLFGIFVHMPVCVCMCVRVYMNISVCICVYMCACGNTGVQVRKLGVCATYLVLLA